MSGWTCPDCLGTQGTAPLCWRGPQCPIKAAYEAIDQMLGFGTPEQDAKERAANAAARAREARIQAAREAVLEAARAEHAAVLRCRQDYRMATHDEHTSAMRRYRQCVVAMIEAEGETP